MADGPPRGDGAPLGRLTERAAFKAAARHGAKAVRPGLVLQARQRRPDEGVDAGARYGLTASRRVGKAVARNRARRRLRALAREVLPHGAAPGYDYVLIARHTTPQRPYARLRGDLLGALRKLGLRRRDGPE